MADRTYCVISNNFNYTAQNLSIKVVSQDEYCISWSKPSDGWSVIATGFGTPYEAEQWCSSWACMDKLLSYRQERTKRAAEKLQFKNSKYRKGMYIKLSTRILNDRKWVELPDSEWRYRITRMFLDPKVAKFYDPGPGRNEWLTLRPKLAKLVFERDEHKCKYCGSTKKLEIDHIVPLAKGGTNDLENLQILCKTCNSRKGARWDG